MFPLGEVVATLGALEICQKHNIDPKSLVTKHWFGEWGDLDDQDMLLNFEGLAFGHRIFSSYKISDEDTIWIITEADRSSTTLLTPEEY